MSIVNMLPSEKINMHDRQFIINCLDRSNMLSDSSLVRITNIEPAIANSYIGDFHGLLKHIGVSSDSLEIITTLNGLLSSQHYDGTVLYVKVVDRSVLKKLYTTQRAKKK